ncbi:MAG: hypothetical protein ACK2UH_13410, partial [Candidatus Promineifilaceae bacterium]
MRWPGQIYDGEAARKMYIEKISAAAKQLKLKLDLRPVPLHSLEEAQAWLAEAAQQNPDGLLVTLLDRQEHSWPSAVPALVDPER